MTALPLSARLDHYLEDHQLQQAFHKQLSLFLHNPFYPSLRTEILEPKHLRIYSFRITRTYRAVFIYRGSGMIEIVDVNNHYQK